jgi:D-aminopeptidase
LGNNGFETLRFIPWGNMDRFYEAVVQAVEEAVLNSLTANETMVGRNGHRSPCLPRERLAKLFNL